MRLVFAFGLLLLAGCCPPALQPTPTAFRAEVLGTTPAASLLYLQQARGEPLLNVEVAQAALEAADGSALLLQAFEPGDDVYVSGTVSGDALIATEVRRLE